MATHPLSKFLSIFRKLKGWGLAFAILALGGGTLATIESRLPHAVDSDGLSIASLFIGIPICALCLVLF